MDPISAGLTFFATVMTGVTVFVVGQWITRFFLDPVIELRKTVGEIDHALVFHANVYTNLGSDNPESLERRPDTIREFRRLGALLLARARAIVLYKLAERLGWVPPLRNVVDAQGHCNLISNVTGVWETPDIHLAVHSARTIRTLLGLPDLRERQQ